MRHAARDGVEQLCARTTMNASRLLTLERYCGVMRHALFLMVIIGGLWVIDTVAFESRNGRAIWSEVNYKAKMFRYEVDYWLRRNLGR